MPPFIGDSLREFRIEKNWTQEQLATELGVARTLLVQMENGTREVSERTMQKFIELSNRTEIPKSFLKRNSEGRRMGNVVDVLIKSGIKQNYLRDEVFKIPGGQLSSMYVGLIPISKKINDILINQFGINWNYIEKGDLPMFKPGSRPGETINDPKFFESPETKVALYNILESKYLEWKTKETSLPRVEGYVKLWEYSMEPELIQGDFLGLGLCELSELEKGKIYYFFTDRQILIGRVKAIKEDIVEIGFKNSKYKNIQISLGDIKYLFPVLTRTSVL